MSWVKIPKSHLLNSELELTTWSRNVEIKVTVF